MNFTAALRSRLSMRETLARRSSSPVFQRGRPVAPCWRLSESLEAHPDMVPPKCAARRSVGIPLEFLPYIRGALGHGRWFWCLLFISSLCPSSTLPLPLKRHRSTTHRIASRQVAHATGFCSLPQNTMFWPYKHRV